MEAIHKVKLKSYLLKQRQYFPVRFLKARELQGKKEDSALYEKHKQTRVCQKLSQFLSNLHNLKLSLSNGSCETVKSIYGRQEFI